MGCEAGRPPPDVAIVCALRSEALKPVRCDDCPIAEHLTYPARFVVGQRYMLEDVRCQCSTRGRYPMAQLVHATNVCKQVARTQAKFSWGQHLQADAPVDRITLASAVPLYNLSSDAQILRINPCFHCEAAACAHIQRRTGRQVHSGGPSIEQKPLRNLAGTEARPARKLPVSCSRGICRVPIRTPPGN